MAKKNSPIIDLRVTQSVSEEENNIYQTNNIYSQQSFEDIAYFDIPLEGEEIVLEVDREFELDFDLPIESNVEEDSGLTNPNSQIPIKIEFIPRSAKRKAVNVNKLVWPNKKIFIINKSIIYGARTSLFVFLALCITLLTSIPSLHMLNKAVLVKDNLLLQAAASEKLLSNTKISDFNELSASLNAIANGANKSSADIASIQGNLTLLLSILPGLSMIQDGSDLAKDVANVVDVTSELSQALEPFVSKEINPFDTSKQVTLVDGISKIKDINSKLVPALDKLHNSLNKLPINLVPGYKGDIVRQLNNDIPKLKQVIIDSEPYADVFLNFVGSDMLKRYVFIFQNNQELRATGGFIGSFGLMNIDRGVVKSLDIKEIYNPDGQLSDNILPPNPLQELTSRWYLRDSNWFADFPTSAQKIISFYEKTGGVTPDGVISLTPTVIERLLLITGPINLDNYGVTINADNFLKVTQYQTGVAYDKVENKPKQFIADLAPILINKLLSSDASQYQKIIEALNNSFQEKQILLYFLEPGLQDLVNKYNLGGKLYDTPKDYLSIVHSNIGGYKTDGVMQENLDISTNLQDNGKIKNKIIINREHKGGNTEYEWWNKDNINYMRIYIPKGSRILNVSGYTDKEEKANLDGLAKYKQDSDLKSINETLVHNEDWDIDTFEESGKLVVGGWVVTKPGESSQVMIEYELPFSFRKGDIYSLILQKQAGTLGVKYKYSFDIPTKRKVGWEQSSFDLEKTESGYRVLDGVLRTDEYIGLQIK